MYTIEYYIRGNGRQPVVDWRDALNSKLRKVIDGKLLKLGQYGLQLIGTDIVKRIAGDDTDFFELRGGQCRIATYYNRQHNKFIL